MMGRAIGDEIDYQNGMYTVSAHFLKNPIQSTWMRQIFVWVYFSEFIKIVFCMD